MTSGIVSALGRSGLGIEKYEDFIQTDASINPGNSGGALVNLRGELVGINTAIVGPNGGSVGIGFAIPFNMAQQIIEQLIEHGEVKRGRLGFTAQDLTPELAQAFGLEQSKGVVVARVEPKSAADKAGMVAGDVIVRVNGEEISRSSDVRNKIGLTRVGDAIQLEVIRNGKLKRLTARIAAQKVTSKAAEQFSSKLAGAEISLTEIEKTNGSAKSVLVISKLKPGSAAAYAGLRPGDIILSVNQQPVSDFASLEQAIKLETRGLLFNIQRGRRALFLIIQ